MFEMSCEFVQERLSAFLDFEERAEDINAALAHLYGCENCQDFFSTAVKVRSVGAEDRAAYPYELDDAVLRRVHEKRATDFLRYRLRLPAYVVSAAAVLLIVISFAFGFMVNRSLSQREIEKAMSNHGLLVMPQQTVYPVMSRQ